MPAALCPHLVITRPPVHTHSIFYSISAVERETGLQKDLLRMWERRYGFPSPSRDEQGDRVYSHAEVMRLRLLHRLLILGHRPSALMSLPDETLRAMVGEAGLTAGFASSCPWDGPRLTDGLQVASRAQPHEIDRFLSETLLSQGLEGFLRDVLMPMALILRSAAWRQEVDEFCWRIFAEHAQRLLAAPLLQLSGVRNEGQPLVLLASLPGESCGLDLIIAECNLRLNGLQCLPLGLGRSSAELSTAANRMQIDSVLLQFDPWTRRPALQQAIQSLVEMFPETTSVWIGGGPSRLTLRGLSSRVQLVQDVGALQDVVQAWRAERRHRYADC